jgi:hypothetical protein
MCYLNVAGASNLGKRLPFVSTNTCIDHVLRIVYPVVPTDD